MFTQHSHIHTTGCDVYSHIKKLGGNAEGGVIEHAPACFEGRTVASFVDFTIFSQLKASFVVNLCRKLEEGSS